MFAWKTTKNSKKCLNGVEVARFGVSLGRNAAPGAPEPLGLLPGPKTGLNKFFSGILALRAPGPGPQGPGGSVAVAEPFNYLLFYDKITIMGHSGSE